MTTEPQSQPENRTDPQPKSGRDIIVFGVLIVIGVAVAAVLVMKS